LKNGLKFTIKKLSESISISVTEKIGFKVYPNGPKGVHSDSNTAIWKAMVAH
jgi:hypothetical protein